MSEPASTTPDTPRRAGEHAAGEEDQELVAPDHLAGLVDRADAIAVAVPGHAEAGAAGQHPGPQVFEVLGDGRVGVVVGEERVDVAEERLRPEAEGAEGGDAERAGRPFMSVEHAVHRMTGELGDWYDIDAGHLRVGDRADLVIVDPDKLDDRLDDYAEDTAAEYGGMTRMVNRNDETVSAVFVGGRPVFLDGAPTEVLGRERTGSFLRAGRPTPAPTTKEELADVG